MEQQSTKQDYRLIIGVLAVIALSILVFVGAILVFNRPLSVEAIAATAAAQAAPTLPPTLTPTPAPTVPGVAEPLLICQREAGYAMGERDLVGTVNISDDHLFLMNWVSQNWAVEDLDDALPGIFLGFDVALDVWHKGCAVYDRVQIKVWDRQGETQTHRLTVQAQMDDLLKWEDGELSDSNLILGLQVSEATLP